MEPHYFDKPEKAKDDGMLKLCIQQGYVPSGCLLNGHIVFGIINKSEHPCAGCACTRDLCGGRPESDFGPTVK